MIMILYIYRGKYLNLECVSQVFVFIVHWKGPVPPYTFTCTFMRLFPQFNLDVG